MNFENIMSSLDRRLEPSVKGHLKQVYSTLTMSVLSAAAGSYIHMYSNLSQYIGGFLNLILTTGLLIALYSTPDNGKNQQRRLSYLLGFSALSGLGLGPLIEVTLYIDPTILPTALISTAVIFACFTISSVYGDRLKTLYYGGLLFSGLSLLSMMSLFNIFFRSQMLYQAHIYLGFALMCGFVLYDTALIIEKRRRGDSDYIGHAIMLFVDLVGMFRYLLVLLSDKQRNDRKKKRN